MSAEGGVARAAARADAAPARVVLHQWEISPFCGKVRRILRVKGVAFEVVNYHGLRARKARTLSRAGLLPVLDWGNERIQDSTAIAAFLEQRCPSPRLVPAEPRQAAAARLLEDWADESLYRFQVYLRVDHAAARERALDLLCAGRPAWERAVFAPLAVRAWRARVDAWGMTRSDGASIEAAFLRHLDDLDALLVRRTWLVGEHRSIADLAVAAQLDEIVRTSTLAERVRARPQIARWLAQLADVADAGGAADVAGVAGVAGVAELDDPAG